MHWNNRIFRHEIKHKDGSVSYTYALHEAYYPDGMTIPDGRTENAMCGHYETVDDLNLIASLKQMLRDAKRSRNDVLDYEPKKRKKK